MTEKMMRTIRSYVKREGRITNAQKKALEELLPRYRLTIDQGFLDYDQIFGRQGDNVLEIGFGMGDSLVEMALASRETNFIGVEVYSPGIGSCVRSIHQKQITNVKIICDDALATMEKAIPDQSLSRIHIFFPDPWPKKRHHKRRLIQKGFVALLQRNGVVHIITDDEDYVAHIRTVFSNATFGVRHQMLHRPETKFEKRAKSLGRRIFDMIFQSKIS